MKTIGVSTAKTHLSKILEEVANGETFLITKRGKPVASRSPITVSEKPEIRGLIERFRAEYETAAKGIKFNEIIEFKEMGRR
jgi:antitoxin (DNA-binding transcriptional repressor) of toxin-antitoxin stability system